MQNSIVSGININLAKFTGKTMISGGKDPGALHQILTGKSRTLVDIRLYHILMNVLCFLS
jgi:hypothetical protein